MRPDRPRDRDQPAPATRARCSQDFAAPHAGRRGSVTELIHSSAVSALPTTSGGTATYSFTYTMPSAATPGSSHTLLRRVASRQSDRLNGAWAHASDLPVITAPPAPGALSATSATPTSVVLSWSGSAPGYRIVYKTGASAPATTRTDGSIVDLGNVTTTTVGASRPTPSTRSACSHARRAARDPLHRRRLRHAHHRAGDHQLARAGERHGGHSDLELHRSRRPRGDDVRGLEPAARRRRSWRAVISGTPTAGGSFIVTLSASNANGSDNRDQART